MVGRKMAEGGGIWACLACSFFCPRFFCPLELPASFVRVVVGFQQRPSVPHPRPSRLFFLLTSHRRRSASVSEILNVAPFDQRLLTDVRHPFRSQTRGPDPRNQNPGIGNTGLEKPRGLQPLGSRRNHRLLLEHNVLRAFRLPVRIPSRNRCLPNFAARGRMTAVVLDDGRRRAAGRDQLGTMNHPMHRRPRRRPRKWNNHRRGPGDRYRSSEETERENGAIGLDPCCGRACLGWSAGTAGDSRLKRQSHQQRYGCCLFGFRPAVGGRCGRFTIYAVSVRSVKPCPRSTSVGLRLAILL
jgi:hypothetical protein